MRKVFLVTGFNNWGKTKRLNEMFDVKAFRHNRLHRLPNTQHDFLVLPKSNDDIHLRGYCEEYHLRINKLRLTGAEPSYIASAFCPTRELEARYNGAPKNKTSIDIINELYRDDDVHMLLLQFKWCGHAELRTDEIVKFYSGLSNVKVSIVSSLPDALTNYVYSQLP